MCIISCLLVLGEQVFRPSEDEQNMLTLVGQTVFEVKESGLGELLIDISTQPLSVQAGDLIGFHIVDYAVVPYDVDESRMTSLFYKSLDNVETQGHTIEMQSNLELARTYSLRANIVVSCKLTAVLFSSRKDLVLEDQFTSPCLCPCPCPRTRSPCPCPRTSSLVLVLVLKPKSLTTTCQGQEQGLVNWSLRIPEDKDFPRGLQHWLLLTTFDFSMW